MIKTGAAFLGLVRCEVTVDDARAMAVGDVLQVHVLLRQDQYAGNSQRKQSAEDRAGRTRQPHPRIMDVRPRSVNDARILAE
jgi:hypothetical protein